jgi:hypothetical protein
MRISAWLLIQDCAMKTASKPNTTANATITMVDRRTALFPRNSQTIFNDLVGVIIEASSY